MCRTTFTTRWSPIAMAMVTIALLAAPPAGGQTSVAEDPDGDAFFLGIFQEPLRAPDYMDLISGKVRLESGIFIFELTMAGIVPEEPALAQAPDSGLIIWQCVIDIDPSTFPAGYPIQPNAARPPEFLVQVVWDGAAFNAILIDRRPLLSGEDAWITPIPLSRIGNQLSASVSREMLGSPQSFEWFGVTEVLSGGYGNSSFFPFDFVPDIDWVTWPGE